MLIPQPRVCASHPSPHTQHTRFPSKRRWFSRPSLCTHTHTHSHTHTKKKNHNPVGSRLGMSLHATSQRPLDLGQHLCPWVGLQLCPPILLWFLALTPLAKKRIVVACSIHTVQRDRHGTHQPPKFFVLVPLSPGVWWSAVLIVVSVSHPYPIECETGSRLVRRPT